MAECLACRAELPLTLPGEHTCCKQCGSYRYISVRTAEEDNRDYFNQKEIWKPSTSRLKQRMAWVAHKLEGLFRVEARSFVSFEQRIQTQIRASASVLEIGFGNGVRLADLLANGINAYGIDLSEEAVRRFQIRYPRYAERVQVSTRPQGRFDCIYASALLEHLDEPDQFLGESAEALLPGGWLVLGLPTVSTIPANIRLEHDINFWKPCHRTIYSLKGLTQLLMRNGFELIAHRSLDPYDYRVLNVLLKDEVPGVHYYRTPFASVPGFPGCLGFAGVLVRAMRVRSVTLWTRVLAKRNAHFSGS